MTTVKKAVTFEKAYHRLEEILEAMNGSDVALEESLKLFEEADGLIKLCGQKLKGAQNTIEKLVKDRNGNLAMNEGGRPERVVFSAGDDSPMSHP